MKAVALAVIVAISLTTTGCATMFHGSNETISVRSEEANTRFYLNNRDLGTGTSAITSVPKKELKSAVLRAEKEGCNTKSTPVATQFDAVSLLGILWDFGIVTILCIDWAATGATTQAAQKDYVLTPECEMRPL